MAEWVRKFKSALVYFKRTFLCSVSLKYVNVVNVLKEKLALGC